MMPEEEMPDVKNEKQFQALKELGYSSEKAAYIVNVPDSRSLERTTDPYEALTKEELYQLAQKRDIDGRSGMTKAELIAALRRQ